MSRSKVFSSLFIALAFFAAAASHAQTIAPTPPMGWNSWDAYGFTIDEADFKANTAVLAGLRNYGWQYAVIDEGWYMRNTAGKNLAERQYIWDENGLLVPDPARFADAGNGQGFKPLADWVHAQGLKFGIHIVRGIPRDVVKANLPIADTSFHAEDAADTTNACPWDDGNWGVKDNAAGQAYYDSMIKLYAKWGLDFLKVDCISDHPYRPTEILQIAESIRKAGRPIVLSLSPGPTSLERAVEVGQYAQMWRISDDHWDVWSAIHEPGKSEFPFGTKQAFDRLASWVPYVKPGNWPDMDMLPWGWLGPHPGLGQPRQTRESHDEQQTEFTLWAIARSPLIVGANLMKLDDFSRSLMTNQTMLDINQKGTNSHPLDQTKLPAGFENARVWRSTVGTQGKKDYAEYFAFFNFDDSPVTLKATWNQLGLAGKKHTARNVWSDKTFHDSADVEIALPAHGSTVFAVR